MRVNISTQAAIALNPPRPAALEILYCGLCDASVQVQGIAAQISLQHVRKGRERPNFTQAISPRVTLPQAAEVGHECQIPNPIMIHTQKGQRLKPRDE